MLAVPPPSWTKGWTQAITPRPLEGTKTWKVTTSPAPGAGAARGREAGEGAGGAGAGRGRGGRRAGKGPGGAAAGVAGGVHDRTAERSPPGKVSRRRAAHAGPRAAVRVPALARRLEAILGG